MFLSYGIESGEVRVRVEVSYIDERKERKGELSEENGTRRKVQTGVSSGCGVRFVDP